MNILISIQTLALNKQYALRPHALTHMLSEGFDEKDIIESIGNGKIIEDYYEEDRCLISGKFQLTEKTYENLHVVIDYWSESGKVDWIDIVTAYIPRPPFWRTPYIRGKRK
ncbi:MAG: hypothetical protein OMM_09655 [Candidatus Magnetoglobus multicellularis str. Araruama]|uniref:DUF4258 domain-containing protein n=1 Tax=Candidatus Magnetoglobus multicellularis str. Araruama TaxID=890399 RepID=A0A1V1P3A9_9BACT|nr:MAG: hypothetical protein OMM_09655 [Candidatus Magnetoglobus multicellularis str. Araruama]